MTTPQKRQEPLPPCVTKAFVALGTAQRDLPETAMENAQRALGGGVLSFAIEHTGDLTHRMTEHIGEDHRGYGPMSAGYGNVEEKVDKVLSTLRHGYGFRREHNENMVSNANYHGVPLETYLDRAHLHLLQYAAAHRRLRVYNAAQFNAREAAVALGKEQFEDAAIHLEALARHLPNEGDWVAYATEYKLDQRGCPLAYPWK